MQVKIRPKDIDPSLIEDYGLMDIVAGSDKIQLNVGLSEKLQDKNPWSYTEGHMMCEEMWDMFSAIGQGAYVSPNVGAQFANFEPSLVQQAPHAPMKSVYGALNHLLIDNQMTEPVVVDPGKGVVSACFEAAIKSVMVVHTHDNGREEELKKFHEYAYVDKLRVTFLDDPTVQTQIQIEEVLMDVPIHKDFYRSINKYHLIDSDVYLGANGSRTNKFLKARGFEINPYHTSAYRFIDNASETSLGVVNYMLRGGSNMKVFFLRPSYYRYLPRQIPRYHRLVKARDEDISAFLVCFSHPVVNAVRMPPPPMRVLTSDTRFMICTVSFNSVTDFEGKYQEDEEWLVDIPGTDTFYSRYGRIIAEAWRRGKKSPILYKNMSEALRAQSEMKGGRLWMVTTAHTDPVELVLGHTATHYLYWLDFVPEGSFYCRYGMMYSVVSDESVIYTPDGAKDGVKCVMLVHGRSYRMKRDRYPVWTFRPGAMLSPVFVDPQRYLTCSPPVKSGEKPIRFYYSRTKDCVPSCLRCHVDDQGNVREYCCEDHTLELVFCFSNLYSPMGFDQFSRVPWKDEFVSDYYENENVTAPIGFEDAYTEDY